jgi:RHS repeat-associated protein
MPSAYDAFGTIAASTTSALPTPWRYQGELLVNPAGASDLYADGARFYAPGLGVFTQLDTAQGSALNPLSLNRFLYAAANPETMIDPSGHTTIDEGDAYNSTLVHDSTHKHTTTRHLSGIQKYPGWNWKQDYADRKAARKAHLAQLRHTGEAGIEAQDAATAEVGAVERNGERLGFAEDATQTAESEFVTIAGTKDRESDNGTDIYGTALGILSEGLSDEGKPEMKGAAFGQDAGSGSLYSTAGKGLAVAGAAYILSTNIGAEIQEGAARGRSGTDIALRVFERTFLDVTGATGGGILGATIGAGGGEVAEPAFGGIPGAILGATILGGAGQGLGDWFFHLFAGQ